MFNSKGLHGNTAVHNKENAVVGSVQRTGKAGLLAGKDALSSEQPVKAVGKPVIVGSPSLSTLTPRAKRADGKQQKTRTGLREIIQTPSAGVRIQKPTPLRPQSQVPMTIKRRPGLFTPQVRPRPSIAAAQEPSELLEPEYAPSKPATSIRFDPVSEFGCDLDIGLVPRTQSSFFGARARELPAPDLVLEELVGMSDEPASPCDEPSSLELEVLAIPPLAYAAAPLVAQSLYPSRIPRLKRKR
ncbi:hypothetical protein GGF46_003488 [Coemansia sp. RSA 552]|nr:hypothetical protein GGF46_003488 [Coemansia sp. RSA 552]